jgi:predicted double-glycine peptidase
LQKFGLYVTKRNGNIDNIEYLVSCGKPTIVLLRSGAKTWHYVVVIGFNDTHIVIADPGWGEKWSIPIEAFKGAWDFRTDMGGTRIEGADILSELLHWAEITGNTYIEIQ